jgi:hypothetical protein
MSGGSTGVSISAMIYGNTKSQWILRATKAGTTEQCSVFASKYETLNDFNDCFVYFCFKLWILNVAQLLNNVTAYKKVGRHIRVVQRPALYYIGPLVYSLYIRSVFN